MIKYLIIDDESIAHDIIKGYCDLLPNFELKKNCYDALGALQYLSEQDVDLIFLDLNMPKLKGFDFLKTLSAPPKVIVTTAYAEFALEGFDLNVVDYLLKPFSFERFLKAVNKATSSHKIRQGEVGEKGKGTDRFFVRGDKKYSQVIIDELLYVEASGNYTKLFTKKENIITREKLSTILTLLPSPDFLQVHKSFAVAVKHIKSVEGNQISIGDQAVPIGKIYRASVIQLFK